MSRINPESPEVTLIAILCDQDILNTSLLSFRLVYNRVPWVSRFKTLSFEIDMQRRDTRSQLRTTGRSPRPDKSIRSLSSFVGQAPTDMRQLLWEEMKRIFYAMREVVL